MSEGFAWGALMRAGMNGLGLHPAEFWALTPAELKIMLGTAAARTPMLSDGLEALMTLYPDAKEEDDA